MRIRTYSLALAAAVAAVALAAPQEVLLRRTLQPNTKDVYAVEMDTKSVVNLGATGMGEQEMDIKGTMTITMATGAVADGKADLEIKTTDMKFEYGGLAAMAQGMMGE